MTDSSSKHLNVEIKAKCAYPDKIRAKLEELNAKYIGCDHQVDVYFNIPTGRLKLRKGNIENSLIFYQRNNQSGPVVDKERHIYFIDNVKFHVDQVKRLGSFMEIEAIDQAGTLGRERLLSQCQNYMEILQIEDADLITKSYSDML